MRSRKSTSFPKKNEGEMEKTDENETQTQPKEPDQQQEKEEDGVETGYKKNNFKAKKTTN